MNARPRTSEATWTGGVKDGTGTFKLGSGACSGSFSFKTRFENEDGSNPEELIAAAHASCFSMALSHILGEAGFHPKSIATTAKVDLHEKDGAPTITQIQLQTEGDVPDCDPGEFNKHANEALQNCPVSRLLSGAAFSLTANLKQTADA